jgi:hypothetical protein
MIVVYSFHPLECARSLHNQVVLSIVNQNLSLSSQQLFDKVDVGHHEVEIHGLVNFIGLTTELDVRVEGEQFFDVRLTQELGNEHVRIVIVLSNIVHIDITCFSYNIVQNVIKGVVEVLPSTNSILECSIDDHLLYFRSFLVVDQA